jgi:hypothetical protein
LVNVRWPVAGARIERFAGGGGSDTKRPIEI